METIFKYWVFITVVGMIAAYAVPFGIVYLGNLWRYAKGEPQNWRENMKDAALWFIKLASK